MAQKFIGLDLGSGSIRVVTLRQGLWGIEGIDSQNLELPNELPYETALRQGLQNLHTSGVLDGETVIVSIPGDEVMSRVITLPFVDPKKIAQVVPYEIEGFIPMNVEDLVIDHQILDIGEERSRVLVAAVPKKTIGMYLAWLKEAGIDPKIIGFNSLALYHAVRFLDEFQRESCLVLDLGRKKSALCAVDKRGLRMVRTLLFGEEKIENELAAKGKVDLQVARKFLRENGLKNEELNADEAVLLEATGNKLDSLIQELKTTLQVIISEGGDPITHLFVCGEGAQIPGLAAYLSQALEMPLISMEEVVTGSANRILPLKKRENIFKLFSAHQREVFITGLGLIFQEMMSGGGSWINFRQGEFLYGKEAKLVRRRLLVLGGLALIILSLGFLDLYFHFHHKETRYVTLKAELRQAYEEMFPDAITIVDEIQQTRTALEKMKKKIERFGTGEVTPLRILAALTSRMPERSQVEVYDLTIDHAKVRMEAEAASFEAIDGIKNSLQRVDEIKEVFISDARVSANQNRVKFRITLEWREGI